MLALPLRCGETSKHRLSEVNKGQLHLQSAGSSFKELLGSDASSFVIQLDKIQS